MITWVAQDQQWLVVVANENIPGKVQLQHHCSWNNIQEVKDFIAKEFQLEIAEKFEGKLVSHCVFRAILRCV